MDFNSREIPIFSTKKVSQEDVSNQLNSFDPSLFLKVDFLYIW